MNTNSYKDEELRAVYKRGHDEKSGVFSKEDDAHEAGLRAVASFVEKGKWIAVSKALPPRGSTVLVFAPKHQPFTARYYPEAKEGFRWIQERAYQISDDKITHWSYIALPEESLTDRMPIGPPSNRFS
jgi:hypothetical protein